MLHSLALFYSLIGEDLAERLELCSSENDPLGYEEHSHTETK